MKNDEIYKRIMIMDSIKNASAYMKTCEISKSDLNKLCKRYNVFVPPNKVTKEDLINTFINANYWCEFKEQGKK